MKRALLRYFKTIKFPSSFIFFTASFITLQNEDETLTILSRARRMGLHRRRPPTPEALSLRTR